MISSRISSECLLQKNTSIYITEWDGTLKKGDSLASMVNSPNFIRT